MLLIALSPEYFLSNTPISNSTQLASIRIYSLATNLIGKYIIRNSLLLLNPTTNRDPSLYYLRSELIFTQITAPLSTL
ncbi:hypothetical protein PZA11_003308 [Diplocarpon coronariae]